MNPTSIFVSKIITFAHLNQTLTFISVLNICIQIGSTIKSNLYPIHESILNIPIQDYNFCLFEYNTNIHIQLGSTIKSNQCQIHESILNICIQVYNFCSFESNLNIRIIPYKPSNICKHSYSSALQKQAVRSHGKLS